MMGSLMYNFVKEDHVNPLDFVLKREDSTLTVPSFSFQRRFCIRQWAKVRGALFPRKL